VEAEVPGTAELVVIGGGVVGAATAFQAARRGPQPVIIETHEWAGGFVAVAVAYFGRPAGR
jgi:glycine/D-amino acid oxidase-like deaminating enzyme